MFSPAEALLCFRLCVFTIVVLITDVILEAVLRWRQQVQLKHEPGDVL